MSSSSSGASCHLTGIVHMKKNVQAKPLKVFPVLYTYLKFPIFRIRSFQCFWMFLLFSILVFSFSISAFRAFTMLLLKF